MYAAVPKIMWLPVTAGEATVEAASSSVRVQTIERLRQAEVEHLDRAVGFHLHVGRLQIAPDDLAFVRGIERGADLPRDRQRIINGQWSIGDLARQLTPSTSSITSAGTAPSVLQPPSVPKCG